MTQHPPTDTQPIVETMTLGAYVEIIGPEGSIHYRRPVDHPMVAEAHGKAGYRVRVIKPYASFDDMCWPASGEYWKELEWRLRYGSPTKQDLVNAASVLSAYRQMIYDPESKRRHVIRELRKAGAP